MELLPATSFVTVFTSAKVFFEIFRCVSRIEAAATEHDVPLASCVSFDIFVWKLFWRLRFWTASALDLLPALETAGNGILIFDVGPMLLVVGFSGF